MKGVLVSRRIMRLEVLPSVRGTGASSERHRTGASGLSGTWIEEGPILGRERRVHGPRLEDVG
jgi:hypothetical protein